MGLTILVFPVLQLLPIGLEKKVSMNQTLIHLAFRLFVWLMQFVGVLKLSVQGKQRLSSGKGKLVIANHPSLIDVVVLISLLKQTDCVVKQGLWKNPFLKGVVSAAGYISNSDPKGLINDCVKVLRNGRNLIIFPEGTRSKPGCPMKFHRGAANMAINTPIDITPVIIHGTEGGLGKGDKWYQVPKNGQFHLSVKVAENIVVQHFIEIENNHKTVKVRRLNNYLQNFYKEAVSNHV